MAVNKKVIYLLLFLLIPQSVYAAQDMSVSPIVKGKQIVLKSGCLKCHSFVKGKRIDNIESLAQWGDKHLTVKQTEKAIRSCRMDPYCSRILTDKQVKYVAKYLNSLRGKK